MCLLQRLALRSGRVSKFPVRWVGDRGGLPGASGVLKGRLLGPPACVDSLPPFSPSSCLLVLLLLLLPGSPLLRLLFDLVLRLSSRSSSCVCFLLFLLSLLIFCFFVSFSFSFSVFSSFSTFLIFLLS